MEYSGVDWVKAHFPTGKFRADREFDLSDLSNEDWEDLADQCVSAHDWSELLQLRPQFADRCDWEKLDGGNCGWEMRDDPTLAS